MEYKVGTGQFLCALKESETSFAVELEQPCLLLYQLFISQFNEPEAQTQLIKELRCDYLPQRHISCSERCCSMRPFQCLYGVLFHVSRVMIQSEMCLCLTGPLTKEKESEITRSPASNTRRLADKNLGPMLPITKELLRDFYTPFNEKLAKMLRNDSFLWESSSQL